MNFYEKLEAQCRAKNSLLCVGLDPVVKGVNPYEEIIAKNRRIIEETIDFCVCYKPNSAFYEAYGEEGMKALRATLDLIPKEIPVLLDAKRGDIGNTAQAYAKAVFDVEKADAVTLSPYMGKTSAEPFLAYTDKGVFVLCRNSNPGAERIPLRRKRVPGRRGSVWWWPETILKRWRLFARNCQTFGFWRRESVRRAVR